MNKTNDKNEPIVFKEKKLIGINYNKRIYEDNSTKENEEKVLTKLSNKKIRPLNLYDKYHFEDVNRKKTKLNRYKLTDLHLAAQRGDVKEIKKLIENGSNKEERDYSGRTPLYLAAEYGQIDAVKLLIEEKCEINVSDNEGQKALYWIIARCRQIAVEVLDKEGEFRELDDYLLKDKYFLKKIELEPLSDNFYENNNIKKIPKVKSILEYLVEQNDLELFAHPVITNYINFKWNFIKYWSFGKFMIDLIFCVIWNLWGVIKRYDLKHKYDLSTEPALLIFFIIGIFLLIILITIKIEEFFIEFRYIKIINVARLNKIDYELSLILTEKSEMVLNNDNHLEKMSEFLEIEKKNIKKDSLIFRYFLSYYKNKWNMLDLLTLLILFAALATHLADIIDHDEKIARDHIRITSIAILFLSIRVLNNAKVLWEPIGKVIMTLYYIIVDILVWLLIFIIVWIPFTSSFYMLYGNGLTIDCNPKNEECSNGNKTILSEMASYNKAMFFLYTVTLGYNGFNFEKYEDFDNQISELMIGIYIGTTSLIMINIFIALITSTFDKISSSSRSLYIKEKAIEIMKFEHGSCSSTRIKLAEKVPDEYLAFYQKKFSSDDLGIKSLIDPISITLKELVKKCSKLTMSNCCTKNLHDFKNIEKRLDNIERKISKLLNHIDENQNIDILYLKNKKKSV